MSIERTGKNDFDRRAFVRHVVTGSVIGAGLMDVARAAEASAPEGSEQALPGAPEHREVRLERLRPAEIDQAMKICPTLFQPLGTIEWHGVHNIVGLDAVKAHHLCVRAAWRAGGLVAPPLFGGVGGLDQPHTFVIEPENDVHSVLLRSWVEKLCREAVRQGFRAVILLTGHYGAAQQIVVRDAAVRLSRSLAVPVLGTPEYFLADDQALRRSRRRLSSLDGQATAKGAVRSVHDGIPRHRHFPVGTTGATWSLF